ncbi:DUF3558 domain-containing protein [Nocardia sp. X0981]
MGAAALLLFVVAACSDGSDVAGAGEPSASVAESPTSVAARSTLTAPRLQPPAQEGKYVNKDRPDVVFDPCTWISDDAIREAGFDPATRKRGKDFLAEWTFLVCGFESEVIVLSVMSGNVTLEEETEKNGSWQQPITVNGREATMGREPERRDSCTVNIRTKVGAVFVDQLLSHEGRIQGTDPCVDIEKTAAIIEREIGEEN